MNHFEPVDSFDYFLDQYEALCRKCHLLIHANAPQAVVIENYDCITKGGVTIDKHIHSLRGNHHPDHFKVKKKETAAETYARKKKPICPK